jgi:hypothetical protein
VVGGTCLVALAGLELVQRLVPATSRQRHNDVAGFIYAALGVIYAVLIALVVIAVWEEYDAASVTVEQEANALAEIFWLAHRLPEPEGSHIQELARSYAHEVVDKEWPLMEQGQAPLMTQTQGTPAGWTLIDEIRANLQEFQPQTPADAQLYAEAHRLMVLTLASVIGLVLFTIGAMEHPFSGGARIGTEAFDLILERFETSKLSNLR